MTRRETYKCTRLKKVFDIILGVCVGRHSRLEARGSMFSQLRVSVVRRSGEVTDLGSHIGLKAANQNDISFSAKFQAYEIYG